MMNLDNKTERKELMQRYLEAETTVAEETALAEYYATHEAEADEKAFAQMITLTHNAGATLSEADTQEYDDIMAGGKTRSLSSRLARRIIAVASVAAAAILVFLFFSTEEEETFAVSPAVVAESIDAIMNLDYDNIESVTAKPNGSTVIIVAKKKDGSSSTYLMAHNEKDGTTTLFAWDN
ncbi:MAG: hypothetical protein J6Y82_02995 [Bacteroidales bacterium]|nr:hypothetical protein [Bacteroidales bacterium]